MCKFYHLVSGHGGHQNHHLKNVTVFHKVANCWFIEDYTLWSCTVLILFGAAPYFDFNTVLLNSCILKYVYIPQLFVSASTGQISFIYIITDFAKA